MFCLTFVLEDWAIYELVPLPRYRKTAAMLVTSSFVTAVHQSHTFSNSLETILVLWAHVVIQRIWASARQASLYSAGILGFICAMGLWNRITFPAYVLLPCLSLIPHLLKK